MVTLCIVAEDRQAVDELCGRLTGDGYSCSVVSGVGEVTACAIEGAPALVLLQSGSYSRMRELARAIKQGRDIPVIALLHREMADNLDVEPVNDFIFGPWDIKELELRIKRQLRGTVDAGGEIIKCGDLVIDVSRYEVYIGGSPVALTFKEYELLKFLAGSPDRVFTRETLLNRVWGYDYYGGDRTVDVHIQRLRGKIEGSRHAQIETVRNIGYRLKVD